MGLKVQNNTTTRFNDDIQKYFNIDIEDSIKKNDYEILKKDIYNLDIDYEEKSNIINMINKISVTKSLKEKNTLIKKIEDFKKTHNL